MLEKVPLDNGTVRVTFRISREIWADRIALVGDFNNWDLHRHCLRQTRDDENWHITLELEAGRAYRFRYVLDEGEWICDDHADGCIPDPYGGFDSVVYT
ncbi:MAG: isoamylase early set domain-containing protein [Anaerolineae bacterium]